MSAATEEIPTLPPVPAELEARIDEAITHYPVSKRSAVLPLLHLLQEHFGFLGAGTEEWVARKLELEPVNVYEVITFYPMFRRRPGGRHHIRVCRTLSCALGGSYELMQQFCDLAKIDRSHATHHAPDFASSTVDTAVPAARSSTASPWPMRSAARVARRHARS